MDENVTCKTCNGAGTNTGMFGHPRSLHGMCSECGGSGEISPSAAPGVVEALKDVRRSLFEGNTNAMAINDTLWMGDPCPETVLDFIDATLERAGSE